MSYFIYYDGETFIGVTPFPWISLPAISIIEVEGEVPDLNKVSWDTETLSLIRNNPILTKLDFMSRFTSAERITVQQSTDPIVKDAMNLVTMADFVDVTDMRTMQLVGYLAMTGIITNTRVAEVLA